MANTHRPSMVASSSSSNASIHKKRFKYDVFLSFRGEDTRKNFVDHLYNALKQQGIDTYKDDERIKQGKRIDNELIESIEDSKFFIIVFSQNYASSSWCLDELVKIMACHNTMQQTAYPVFYDVEPSQVRKQSGAVGNAFARHKNEESAGKWRAALKEAADLAGWELKNFANGHEAKLIQKILEEISLELCSINLGVDEKLVGMESRIKDIVSIVETGSYEVRMIGIKGMGGGGKTTLARAVFDQISVQFEGKSFVENVREVSKDSLNGLKSLQKQLLSDVLTDQGITVTSISQGKNLMKRRLCGRRVIVVLDDVDHIDQLEALAGSPNWFKTGSIVIITTRDEQVLVAHRVNLILDVSLLSHEEAICLFSRYAFGREFPVQGYEELSRHVVRYAAGLPLTVRVLGSFLCGKNELEWKDALERLKRIPLKETLEKLELSYIGLEDDYKEIFLDVACLLKGWHKIDAIRALESCGYHARNGLRVLEQKSLITINDFGELGMHDHIEEMGQNIVRREHPNEPNKHSRLWIKEEVEDILANHLGTEATRCISVKLLGFSPDIFIKGLINMKKLRALHVYSQNSGDCFRSSWEFDDVSQYFSNALRYLNWEGYPYRSLPKTFEANNLVALEMSNSNIEQFWEGGERKVLNNLTFLDFSFSNFTKLDLGMTPKLHTLNLEGCYNLVELDMSVECQELTYLNVDHSKLKILDLRFTMKLKTFTLDDCHDLVEFHMPINECLKLTNLQLTRSKLTTLDIQPIPNLERLLIEDCNGLIELHMPINGCVKLADLKLTGSKLSTLDLRLFTNLKKLCLKECDDLVELHMPNGCSELTSLYLNLSKLKILDLLLTSKLKTLTLHNCHNLVELHMPINECLDLTFLELTCSKLRTLDLRMTPNVVKLCLKECHDLIELKTPVGCLNKLVHLDLSDCSGFKHLVLNRQWPSLKFHLFGVAPVISTSNSNHSLPEFQFNLLYEEQASPPAGNLEKLISLGLCRPTDFNIFSESIYELRDLKNLTLIGGITEAPKYLDKLECLEKLHFLSTRIKHLPDSICMLKHLKSLILETRMHLETLPEDIGQLECLETLHLLSTRIKRLPDSICMLKHLKSFKLESRKHLEKLPEDFGRLECLETLHLLSTCITHLPDSICMLKHLKSLKLESCWLLEKLPEDIGQLQCLEYLAITECVFLRYIPDSLCKMKRLKQLHLPYCILVEKLPEELGNLKCLVELDIVGTGVSHLPHSIFFVETSVCSWV